MKLTDEHLSVYISSNSVHLAAQSGEVAALEEVHEESLRVRSWMGLSGARVEWKEWEAQGESVQAAAVVSVLQL